MSSPERDAARRFTARTTLTATDTSLYSSLVVTDSGIFFWGASGSIRRLSLTGGVAEVVATGEFTEVWEAGANLLLLERGDQTDQDAARKVFEVPAASSAATPLELFSTADGESILGIDGTHAYVYNAETTALSRIALSGAAREDLATGLDINDPELAGSYLSYIDGNERVFRFSKSGGPAERLAYVPHIPWSLAATEDTLIVGAWESVCPSPAENRPTWRGSRWASARRAFGCRPIGTTLVAPAPMSVKIG